MLNAIVLPLAAITGLGKTVLIIVAGAFILWSLVTALSIPKRNPRFPENMGVYLTITAVLFVAQIAAVVWVTSTQEVEHEKTAQEGGSGEETTPGETTTTETTTTETTTTETTTTETTATTEEPGGAAEGDPAAGKEVFASAGCGACHTLADAGASGSVGPVLDEAKPPYELVVDRVTNGKNAMPSFKGQLDEKQIADVAAYVSSVAGT